MALSSIWIFAGNLVSIAMCMRFIKMVVFENHRGCFGVTVAHRLILLTLKINQREVCNSYLYSYSSQKEVKNPSSMYHERCFYNDHDATYPNECPDTNLYSTRYETSFSVVPEKKKKKKKVTNYVNFLFS